MKNLTTSILALMLLLGSCASEPTAEETKANKHQKALDEYAEIVTKYNDAVVDICECIEEKKSKYACNQYYNKLSFDISDELSDNLSGDEMDFGQLIEDGNAKIEACAEQYIVE